MGPKGRTVEGKVALIASTQHGVVTRRQLLEAGLSAKQIRTRLERGALIREHPGVYRVGHRAPSVDATYLAAVLAAGDRSLLCGRAAAHLWTLVKGDAPPAEVLTAAERRIEGSGHTGAVPSMSRPRTRQSAAESGSRAWHARSSTSLSSSPTTRWPGRATRQASVTASPPRLFLRCSGGDPAPRAPGSSDESSRETPGFR